MANPHVPCIHCGEIITWRCAYEIRRAKQGPACSKECARAHMYRESRARLAAKVEQIRNSPTWPRIDKDNSLRRASRLAIL